MLECRGFFKKLSKGRCDHLLVPKSCCETRVGGWEEHLLVLNYLNFQNDVRVSGFFFKA